MFADAHCLEHPQAGLCWMVPSWSTIQYGKTCFAGRGVVQVVLVQTRKVSSDVIFSVDHSFNVWQMDYTKPHSVAMRRESCVTFIHLLPEHDFGRRLLRTRLSVRQNEGLSNT